MFQDLYAALSSSDRYMTSLDLTAFFDRLDISLIEQEVIAIRGTNSY